MTENAVAFTKSQVQALAEVIRSEAERNELLVWCDRVMDGQYGPTTSRNTFIYDLGVAPDYHEGCDV